MLTGGAQAEDKNKTEIILGSPNRGLLQADNGCCKNNKCKDNGSCSITNQEANLLRSEIATCPQRCQVPFRDSDSPTPH